MQNEYPAWLYSFSTALETEFVGRKALLKQIHDDLLDPTPGPRVITVQSGGGYGKTFLLKKVLTEASMAGQVTQKHIIDLYHLTNHTPDLLAHSIIQSLTIPDQIDQESYLREWSKLNLLRIKNAIKDFTSQNNRMLDAFLDIMQSLSKNQRVVLTLDTLERLAYLRDASRNRINTWDWLLSTLPEDRWGNVTLILAGRPQAYLLFNDLSRMGSRIQLKSYEVPEFDLDDRMEYFDAVANAASRIKETEPDAEPIERIIRGLVDEGLAEKYAALEGRPILLSLLIHALCLDAVFDPTRPITSDEDSREILEKKVVTHLVDAPGIGDTIRALGRLRKGADRYLLAQVTGETPECAWERLRQIERLSFIKRLPDEERYFLHDEMYAILDRHIYQGQHRGKDRREQDIAEYAIREYYREKIESLPANVVAYRHKRNEPVDKKITEEDAHDFSIQMLRREEAMAEALYYHLRHNPVRGFRYYYRFMRIAFRSADTSFAALLMADLLSFSKEYQAGGVSIEEGLVLPPELIRGELLLYPVFRRYFEKDYSGCLDEIEILEDRYANLFNPDDRLGLYANLLIWKSYCLQSLEQNRDSDLSRNLLQARECIDEAIWRLDHLIREWGVDAGEDPYNDRLVSDARIWYLIASRALAAYIRASFFWGRGELGEALENYRVSVSYWRRVDVLNELAASINDYAFALSEKGLYNTAYRLMMKSCLELRLIYGTSYQMALSLNTLGIILMRQGKYSEAIEKSREALKMARAVADRRVEGLVLIALAEEHRRKATSGTIDQSIDQKKQFLIQARKYARRALTIFTNMEGQKLRQVEAQIEVGCACRDLVRVSGHQMPAEEQKKLIQEGHEALQQAYQDARELNQYREIDALVNLAWLGHYSRDLELQLENDRRAMRELEALTYEQRLAHPEREVSPAPLLWTLLGKLYSLRGITRMDLFKECQKKHGEWQSYLSEAVRMFAEGLQYSAKFSTEYLGLRQAEDTIYERMMRLNKHEMKVVREVISEFEKQLRTLPDELEEDEHCLLYNLLRDHGLLSD